MEIRDMLLHAVCHGVAVQQTLVADRIGVFLFEELHPEKEVLIRSNGMDARLLTP